MNEGILHAESSAIISSPLPDLKDFFPPNSPSYCSEHFNIFDNGNSGVAAYDEVAPSCSDRNANDNCGAPIHTVPSSANEQGDEQILPTYAGAVPSAELRICLIDHDYVANLMSPQVDTGWASIREDDSWHRTNFLPVDCDIVQESSDVHPSDDYNQGYHADEFLPIDKSLTNLPYGQFHNSEDQNHYRNIDGYGQIPDEYSTHNESTYSHLVDSRPYMPINGLDGSDLNEINNANSVSSQMTRKPHHHGTQLKYKGLRLSATQNGSIRCDDREFCLLDEDDIPQLYTLKLPPRRNHQKMSESDSLNHDTSYYESISTIKKSDKKPDRIPIPICDPYQLDELEPDFSRTLPNRLVEDTIHLQRTNRKYRRQHQSLNALVGKRPVFCQQCRMQYFYPNAVLHKYVRYVTVGNETAPAKPYFCCRVCGTSTLLNEYE